MTYSANVSAWAASLRRHAAAVGAAQSNDAGVDTAEAKAARASMEQHAALAIQALALNDAIATGTPSVAIAAADLAPACGVALEAAAGNTADVWVLKNF